ncbi:tetratricopeptide repeat protein [Aurantimonas sp. C2-6-R+9]|uniref:tetratricopeptide repeat protein n=1 Tax=unclassified Aurantimonas TaxID=2638230 RepID=UPI002E197FF6|nr:MULTISPECIES: tetratricopeptide repeat protein [unclassified Aurantimonas]MEC5289065.1 tetratricopeptide repeat protein [Aurantimonas sp. C2-3-R2]MEC5379360.1 tetratricopeptide repeat protein [Aurantimonas sp. C2-6-R+9]MEC5410113.1 tetratricopeptide repeat protein [Aurantimonas sp. C2-4-R8]
MQTSRFLTLLTATALFAATAAPAARAAGDGAKAKPALAQAQSLSGAYLAAKSAQRDGDLEAATDFFAQALSMDPTSDLLQQDAMFAFIADGRFKDGVDMAAKLRAAPEASKVARIALGIDALSKGNFDAAIAEFDLPKPSDLDALLIGQLIAWSELGAGRTDAALSRLDTLTGAPWFAIFNDYQKGLLADVAGRPDVARIALRKVVDDEESARTSPDAYLAAAEALARLETRASNTDAALQAIEAGLKLVPTYDPLLHLKERVEKGETIEPAVASVQEGAAETLYILGQAINRGDGQQVALLYFQLARAVAPRNPALLTALAGIAERSERLDLAISYYREIPENSAYRRTAELQIGLDLWYAERKDEAKAHLTRAVRDYPDDIKAHTALADVLAADKEFKGAADALNKAIALSEPGKTVNWNLYYQRGIAFERTKQWDKAEPDFKTALELSPNQPQVLNYLGYSWVDMNENLKEGLDMIKKAVELRPNDGYIIDSLGWAYFRLGRFEEAVEQLERAVLITPMDPTINDHLGDAYWRVGRAREARFQWERALVGEPKPEQEAAKTIRAKLARGLDPTDVKAKAPADGAATDVERAARNSSSGGPIKAPGSDTKAD